MRRWVFLRPLMDRSVGSFFFSTDFGITTGHQMTTLPCAFQYNSTTASNGTFWSPNYPGFYPRDTECHYFFYGQVRWIEFLGHTWMTKRSRLVNLSECNCRNCLRDNLDADGTSSTRVENTNWQRCNSHTNATMPFCPKSFPFFKDFAKYYC